MHNNSTSNLEVYTNTASEVEQPDVVIGQNDEIVHPEPIKRPQRVSNPPAHLQEYIFFFFYIAHSQLRFLLSIIS